VYLLSYYDVWVNRAWQWRVLQSDLGEGGGEGQFFHVCSCHALNRDHDGACMRRWQISGPVHLAVSPGPSSTPNAVTSVFNNKSRQFRNPGRS